GEAPHFLEEALARLHAVLALVQHDEKLELERGELDLVVVDPDAMRRLVDLETAEADDGGFLDLALGPTENGLDAEQELSHAEGLGHVVVGAELEADDAIDLLTARGQHHDRDRARRRVATELAADVGARAVGQHEVEDHEVGQALLGRLQTFTGPPRELHLVPCLAQIEIEHIAQIRLVLDDKNAWHARLIYDSCDRVATWGRLYGNGLYITVVCMRPFWGLQPNADRRTSPQ